MFEECSTKDFGGATRRWERKIFPRSVVIVVLQAQLADSSTGGAVVTPKKQGKTEEHCRRAGAMETIEIGKEINCPSQPSHFSCKEVGWQLWWPA